MENICIVWIMDIVNKNFAFHVIFNYRICEMAIERYFFKSFLSL